MNFENNNDNYFNYFNHYQQQPIINYNFNGPYQSATNNFQYLCPANYHQSMSDGHLVSNSGQQHQQSLDMFYPSCRYNNSISLESGSAERSNFDTYQAISRRTPEQRAADKLDHSWSDESNKIISVTPPTTMKKRKKNKEEICVSVVGKKKIKQSDANQRLTNKKMKITKSDEVTPNQSDSFDDHAKDDEAKEKLASAAKEGKKKPSFGTKRSRHNFTETQSQVLESLFDLSTHYPDWVTINKLSKQLKLSNERIQVWFQNRRAKFRRNSIKITSS